MLPSRCRCPTGRRASRAVTRSGKPIPSMASKVYAERVRYPKWTRLVSPTDVYQLLWRRLPGWSKEDHLDAAEHHARAFVRAAEAHGRIIDKADIKFGSAWSKGLSLIAGGVSAHFPREVNDKLRRLSRLASDERDIAFAHYKAAGKRGSRWAETGLPGADTWGYSIYPARKG